MTQSRRHTLVLVIMLGGFNAMGPLSIDMYLPALPELGRELGTTASSVQLTLTACLAGLALGQLFVGPLSDAWGRRKPLLIGMTAYAISSLLCAIAPSVSALTALRLVQGLTGAAAIVLGRAIVRDMYSGVAMARLFSNLMLVSGLAPVLAPTLGSVLLRFSSWHGIFVVLAVAGALLLVGAVLAVPETLPPERRSAARTGHMVRTLGGLLRHRGFLGYVLASGLAFAAMFAYISGSSFVVQDIYGASPTTFGIIFGVNSVGILIAGQVNARLVARFRLRRLLAFGLGMSAVGGIGLLVTTLAGVGLAGILPCLFLVASSIGIVSPNAAALALSLRPDAAGSASALLGATQFVIGAAIAPLVGLGDGRSALPMAITIAALGIGAAIVFVALAPSGADQVEGDTHDGVGGDSGEPLSPVGMPVPGPERDERELA